MGTMDLSNPTAVFLTLGLKTADGKIVAKETVLTRQGFSGIFKFNLVFDLDPGLYVKNGYLINGRWCWLNLNPVQTFSYPGTFELSGSISEDWYSILSEVEIEDIREGVWKKFDT